MNKIIPKKLLEIPDRYLSKARLRGTVEEFEYDTYDAFTYQNKDTPIKKRALVYLPYDYDDKKKYDIFYLIHGAGGDERTYLNGDSLITDERFKSFGFKNIIDHSIEDGKIDPVIIVCPTYNNVNVAESGSGKEKDNFYYGRTIELTKYFYREIVNDLIPAVETTYSTYSEDGSKDSLIASRDHRCIGGFSMGSVATWYAFNKCLSYFRYFIALSGNLGDGAVEDAAVSASGYGPGDFFIYSATGSEDFARDNMHRQIMNMGNIYSDNFRFSDTMERGNLSYRELEGAVHNYNYANQYIFNALIFFFGSIINSDDLSN